MRLSIADGKLLSDVQKQLQNGVLSEFLLETQTHSTFLRDKIWKKLSPIVRPMSNSLDHQYSGHVSLEKHTDDSFLPTTSKLNTIDYLLNDKVAKNWDRISTISLEDKCINNNEQKTQESKREILINGIAPFLKLQQQNTLSELRIALACLSTQPSWILSLINQSQESQTGLYNIWLNLCGIWTEIPIDDYIPVYSSNKQPVFQQIVINRKQDKEIWAALIEKAISKAYGGYSRIIKANDYDNLENYLQDFTGVQPKIIDLSDKRQNKEEWLIQYLLNARNTGHIIYFSSEENSINGVTNIKRYYPLLDIAVDQLNDSQSQNSSLKSATNSKICPRVLVALLNPYSKNTHFNSSSKNTFSEATDYYQISDIFKKFSSFSELYLNPNSIYSHKVINFERKLQNSTIQGFHKTVLFRITSPGTHIISINQQDLKFFQGKGREYCAVQITIGKLVENTFRFIAHTVSRYSRTTQIIKELSGGDYYILISKEPVASSQPIKIEDNTIILSINGPQSTPMESLDLQSEVSLYDILEAATWRYYVDLKLDGADMVSEIVLNKQSITKNNLKAAIDTDNTMESVIKVLRMKGTEYNEIYLIFNKGPSPIKTQIRLSNIDNSIFEVLWEDGRISNQQICQLRVGEIQMLIIRKKCHSDKTSFDLNFDVESFQFDVDQKKGKKIRAVYRALKELKIDENRAENEINQKSKLNETLMDKSTFKSDENGQETYMKSSEDGTSNSLKIYSTEYIGRQNKYPVENEKKIIREIQLDTSPAPRFSSQKKDPYALYKVNEIFEEEVGFEDDSQCGDESPFNQSVMNEVKPLIHSPPRLKEKMIIPSARHSRINSTPSSNYSGSHRSRSNSPLIPFDSTSTINLSSSIPIKRALNKQLFHSNVMNQNPKHHTQIINHRSSLSPHNINSKINPGVQNLKQTHPQLKSDKYNQSKNIFSRKVRKGIQMKSRQSPTLITSVNHSKTDNSRIINRISSPRNQSITSKSINNIPANHRNNFISPSSAYTAFAVNPSQKVQQRSFIKDNFQSDTKNRRKSVRISLQPQVNIFKNSNIIDNGTSVLHSRKKYAHYHQPSSILKKSRSGSPESPKSFNKTSMRLFQSNSNRPQYFTTSSGGRKSPQYKNQATSSPYQRSQIHQGIYQGPQKMIITRSPLKNEPNQQKYFKRSYKVSQHDPYSYRSERKSRGRILGSF